ncbi:MAG TPA: OmpA family protein [Candidatus Kapabacteria bacterium]|nr:OmpA family protein [Candidatus Kapabacteria bacterium]
MYRSLIRFPKAHTVQLLRLFVGAILWCGVIAPPLRAQRVEWASEVLGYSSQKAPYGSHQNSAEQVLGKPNKCPATGDSPCAWLPASDPDQGSQEEWIKVGFTDPMKIQQVAVAENYYPGAIEKIILFDDNDRKRDSVVYQPHFDGIDAKVAHWIFMPKTRYDVTAVEIVLQPGLVQGPNEIDAIAISDLTAPLLAEINVAPNVNVGVRENLGPNINSVYDEVLPVISPDGRTLYVDRKNHPQNFRRPGVPQDVNNNDNIWYSTQDSEGAWQPLKNIGPMLNNGFGSFVASVTPDGNTLLLGGTYASKPGVAAHFGLWLAHRIADGWSMPEEVVVKDYYTKAIFVEFTLSNDGRTIILSLDRADSYGGKDLYVSFLEPDGTWTVPKNLGPDVNSAADEATPFLAADGETLYFASEGFAGYGSMDMYITRRLDSTWQHWSEPENLGPQLNTPGWDAYYTVPASGEYAYFVSTENSIGMGDIFRVKLPEALRPRPVLLVSGRVVDAKTELPVNAVIKYENLETGRDIGSARTSPGTGAYKITLPAGENYGYRAEAPGYVPVSENLDLTKVTEYQEIERDLVLVPIEKGEVVRLNNIFFETAKAELRPESFAELDRVVKLLEDNSSMEISIGGHTDNVGGAALNVQLSQARAQSVETYLVSKGISVSRMRVKGYGDTKPVATNDTDAGRQQNRRVEFTILKQ